MVSACRVFWRLLAAKSTRCQRGCVVICVVSLIMDLPAGICLLDRPVLGNWIYCAC